MKPSQFVNLFFAAFYVFLGRTLFIGIWHQFEGDVVRVVVLAFSILGFGAWYIWDELGRNHVVTVDRLRLVNRVPKPSDN